MKSTFVRIGFVSILLAFLIILAIGCIETQCDVKPEPSVSVTEPPRTVQKPARAAPEPVETSGPVLEVPPEPTAPPLTGDELYKSYVDEIAAAYFPVMDTSIVKALIYTESRYQPNVQSSAGAVGLTQVMPCYHAWRMEKYGKTDIWDPYTNILVGMDLLNEFYQQYGDWYSALYYYSGCSSTYPNLVLTQAESYR